MRIIEETYNLIRLFREVNSLDTDMIVSNRRLSYWAYEDICNKLHYAQSIEIKHLDLHFAELACTVTKTNFDMTVNLLKSEIRTFYKWYIPNKDLIDANFSEDTINIVIAEQVNNCYKENLETATALVNKSIEDEYVWHMLARSYGSRACGGKTEKDFDEDDWEYIQEDLANFEEHFGKKVGDLGVMYSEYYSIARPNVDKAHKERSKVKRAMDEYQLTLMEKSEPDVFVKLFNFTCPISKYLDIPEASFVPSNRSQQQQAINEQSQKIRRLGTYDSLSDCLKHNDVLIKVEQLAQWYFEKHQKVDSVFGRELLNVLKMRKLIQPNGCAIDHFGELLKAHFGTMCSFKNGRSLSDAVGTVDSELRKQLLLEFPSEE